MKTEIWARSFLGMRMGIISEARSSEGESEPVALERPACKHIPPGHHWVTRPEISFETDTEFLRPNVFATNTETQPHLLKNEYPLVHISWKMGARYPLKMAQAFTLILVLSYLLEEGYCYCWMSVKFIKTLMKKRQIPNVPRWTTSVTVLARQRQRQRHRQDHVSKKKLPKIVGVARKQSCDVMTPWSHNCKVPW